VLAPVVVGSPVPDIAGAWQAMIGTIRNMGRPGVVPCAVSAVDTALWDLKGRLLGLPVCRLLGMVRDAVPV
jgi:L-alanine-DL-glutamate epimerase-like enolase superfamily enzyme